ncbi:MAG: DUF3311 domain-containing protein [Alphaproteobacteria bacterium]|jgi:hypothetical protein|uniref:DUF3311 domain-containing protein n=1 Tax=Methyloceanibacter sp. TaxID=1965321 RepID=UPI003561FD4C
MGKEGRKGWLSRHWPRFLLIIPFALVAWVPAYNRVEPTLAGIPFFYWYQLAAILMGAVVVMSVHLLEKRIRRKGSGGPDDDPSGVAGDIL